MNTNVDLSNLSVEQLRRALQLKEQISHLERELTILSGSPVKAAAKLMSTPRSTLTEAGRARIVAAQRRRWARERALKAAPQPIATESGSMSTRRNLTPEARAKMAAASRERWARVRAEQQKESS
jgi:hypothetical protein